MSPTFSFFLALTAVLAATSNAGGQIYDIDGDFIFDGSYYVLPFFQLQGGLTVFPGRNQLCPLEIGQARSHNNGLPVKFSNWLSRVGFVPESADLNIQMDVRVTICRQSDYWWVDEFDTERKKWFIVGGPKPEGSRKDSLKSFFQIQRVKVGDLIADPYKFVYCHAPGKCNNVGMFRDEHGVERLAISSEPFLVIFKKANVTIIEGSSKIM